jgi:UDP-glucose 4-epimerase
VVSEELIVKSGSNLKTVPQLLEANVGSSQKSALIIGGYGFIGSSVANHLMNNGWRIRIMDRAPQNVAVSKLVISKKIEVFTGDLLNRAVLREALQGVDSVLYFAAHSVPSSNPKFVTGEIEGSLRCLDSLLTSMIEVGSASLVFPSSGGTVYGACHNKLITENDSTAPISSYGMGKLLCEELIKFFHRVHGLEYQILRVANVYGCHLPRKVNQGVIEIFLRKVTQGLPLDVWGNSENVRDYIFIDDLCCSIERILESQPEPGIYNIGTGVGHTVSDVIRAIETVTNKRAVVNYITAPDGMVPRNVLDITKIHDATGWSPKCSLLDGVQILYDRVLAQDKETESV